MANRKELSSDLKNRIIVKYKSRVSLSGIAKQLNVPKSTVQSIIDKYKLTGSIANLPRSGRPTKISERTKRKVLREVSRNPRLTRNDVQKLVRETGVEVSTSTVTNMLRSSGFRARRPSRTPYLKPVNLEARLRMKMMKNYENADCKSDSRSRSCDDSYESESKIEKE
ncbi:uncharacterized protein LOC143233705 [Tachypleus tridentatus]|uniref:uncharacterized protein LOC143233705 n=1 Tax=Tachypleus tridentatus TaxID=6853 RepID=UPI003FD02ED0